MKMFFNEDPRFIPEYSYWLIQDYWNFAVGTVGNKEGKIVGGHECLYLLMNLEPRLLDDIDIAGATDFHLEFCILQSGKSELRENLKKISTTLERALASNTIRHDYLFADLSNKNEEGEKIYFNTYRIKPADLVDWAVSIKLRVAESFLALLEPKIPEGTPPYLDPKHPAFSSELAACVSAWMAVYVDGKGDSSYTERTRIEMFISELYNKKPWERGTSTLEAALSSRLLTVTTPDKDMKGGRKKGPTHKRKK